MPTKCAVDCHPIPLVQVTSTARFPEGTAALRLGTIPASAPGFENAVFNPMVIANKNNPHNLLAVCSQGFNLGYLVDLTLFSTDGGTTWNQSDLVTGRAQGPTLAGAPNDFVSPTYPYGASGGSTHNQSDLITCAAQSSMLVNAPTSSVSLTCPFPASASRNNLYFAYEALQLLNPDGSPNLANALNVTKSHNDGISWNALASIENNLTPPQQAVVNRPTITVNPHNPNTVYAVWGNLQFLLNPALPQTLELQISRDAGNTWSAPYTIATLDVGTFGFNAILHILPDHSPVVIYQSTNPDGTFNIIALKSKNFMQWTTHYAYKNGTIARVSDPDNPSLYYATYTFGADSKINQCTGDLYITWADAKANTTSTSARPAAGVFISHSRDGGRTWSSPIVANPKHANAQTFSPSLAIARNGTVGVSFYDFRKYSPGSFTANLETNLWFALFDHKLECRLDEIRITQESFDARKFTFIPNKYFLISDVGTIDAVGNDFLIAYPITNPPYSGGPLVVQPGQNFTGLPVSLIFARVPTDHCFNHKTAVKPSLKEFVRSPNAVSASMLQDFLARQV